MDQINPGNTPSLERDAHYHPIRATATWAAFVAAMAAKATDSPEARAARDEQRARETTYARGVAGHS